ncbi:MAG: ABC transporter substrate-binding protein [Candidatus Binatia bacterium]
MKRTLILSLLGCVGVLIMVGADSASPQTEWQKVLAAAKEEGKVVVSIPSNAELRKRMEEAFKRRFPGIDLELVAGRGSKNVRRIADEFKAGVRYFDVHIGGSQSMLTGLVLVKQEILDSVEPHLVLTEVKDPKGWWGGHIYADKKRRFAYSFQAYLSKNMWYNPNLAKPQEIRSYDDLLKPRWKGRIAFHDPRIPGAGNSTWSYMWQVKGEEYLRKLVQQELLITRNSRQIAEFLAKGKVALTIGVTFNSFAPFIRAGLPIKPLPTLREGTYASSGHGNLAVLKDPPHPNAAKVYVNWFLGKEGQEIFSKAMGQPTRRLDVDTTWIHPLGYKPAKDFLTVEQYYRYENQSEEKILKVRIPARDFARKLLR